VHSTAGDLAGLDLDVAFLDYVADRLALAKGAVERCKLLRDSKKQEQALTAPNELPSTGIFSILQFDPPALPNCPPEASDDWPACWDVILTMEGTACQSC
jgi:hypothetical protein